MISLAHPGLLLLLALPLLLIRFLTSKTHPKQPAATLPISDQLAQYQMRNRNSLLRFRFHSSSVFAVLIWSLIVLALAGPQWLGPPTFTPRAGRNIMLALDLSGSMSTPDMQYQNQMQTRLRVVKMVAQQFIHNRPNDRIGLIVFGSKAYLQTPLTFDHASLSAMLNDATVGLAGQQTAMGDAIGLAIKRLMRYPLSSRILILLTDGVNNAGTVLPLDATQMAVKEKIKIYTIGLTGTRMTVQTLLGPRVIDTNKDLDEPTLQAIAQLSGGLFFKAQNGNDLKNVYQKLNQLEKTKDQKQYVRTITPLYYYPLGLAFLLSLLLSITFLRNFNPHKASS